MWTLSPSTVATLLALIFLACLVSQALRHKRIVKKCTAKAQPPKANSRKPEWVRRRVLYLAVHLPSCRQIVAVFNRNHGHRATVKKSWVHDFCRQHRDEIEHRRHEMKNRIPEPMAINARWGLDLTTRRTPEGRTMFVLGIVDHGSRVVVRLKALPRKCAWLLIAQLCMAIAHYGKPQAIRTDNEGMFHSCLWQAALAKLGIRHELIAIRCPWENGHIERFFGTLKTAFRGYAHRSSTTLQAALDEFSQFYNHVRVHLHLQGRTPMEVWHGDTPTDVRRRAGTGRWVSALGGRLIGYQLRR